LLTLVLARWASRPKLYLTLSKQQRRPGFRDLTYLYERCFKRSDLFKIYSRYQVNSMMDMVLNSLSLHECSRRCIQCWRVNTWRLAHVRGIGHRSTIQIGLAFVTLSKNYIDKTASSTNHQLVPLSSQSHTLKVASLILIYVQSLVFVEARSRLHFEHANLEHVFQKVSKQGSADSRQKWALVVRWERDANHVK
jgi:hypothetical protein